MKVIAVVLVCGKRYAECASIMLPSFLKNRNGKIIVVFDEAAKSVLEIKHEDLITTPLKDYRTKAEKAVGLPTKSFEVGNFAKSDGVELHDRAFSALKPLIQEYAAAEKQSDAEYILSVDADAYFTGNVMQKVNLILERNKHQFDLYMVERKDPRMLLLSDGKKLGSGFTLWKRKSNFINLFCKHFNKKCGMWRRGGSQALINKVREQMNSKVLVDPYLHFVSPDTKNPNLSQSDIKSFKPAYIHLHGPNAFKRLTKFKTVFEA